MGNVQIKGSVKVAMVGLEGSGKTHFLLTLKYGETNGSIKTIGYNQETIIHENYKINFVDIGSPISCIRSSKPNRVPEAMLDMLLEDIDCLYFFVDGEDDDEALLSAKNRLLALITSERFKEIPVALIQNIKPSMFPGGSKVRRPWEKFKKGMCVENLASWMKIFATDVSYRQDEPIRALLEFTIK